jgi:DNA polymerase II large subunit
MKKKEETEVRDSLFGAKSLVFEFAVQKYKDQDIQNCNFTRCFVWV